MLTILDQIQNKIGTFFGAAADVPLGMTSATISAVMPPAELTDATNTLRLGIEADFGGGFKHMAWGPYWTGARGATAPTLTWQFNPTTPPKQVRGVLENRTQVIVGLAAAFA